MKKGIMAKTGGGAKFNKDKFKQAKLKHVHYQMRSNQSLSQLRLLATP